MNLKEFIAETLNQIVDGVVEAQSYAKGKGAEVAPTIVTSKGYGNTYRPTQQEVEFDVAVTVQENQEKAGRGGLRVAWFDFGGEVSSGEQSATVSRVKFGIPIDLPSQEK